ncbi:hypothetical protein SB861_21070 [Paraburkholderia sp. SIMBA_049]
MVRSNRSPGGAAAGARNALGTAILMCAFGCERGSGKRNVEMFAIARTMDASGKSWLSQGTVVMIFLVGLPISDIQGPLSRRSFEKTGRLNGRYVFRKSRRFFNENKALCLFFQG